MSRPWVSVIVPVHEEELLLRSTLDGLREALGNGAWELVVCENGSRDRSRAIARRFCVEEPRARLVEIPEASYGEALRRGLLSSRAQRVVLVDVDLWDAEFIRDAVARLERCEAVVASKRLGASRDRRSLVRRSLSAAYTAVLRGLADYRGTDTHGMKAMRRDAALRALSVCVTRDAALDSELLIRIQRSGGRIVEVPVEVRELRVSRRSVLQRAPGTVLDLIRLGLALRRSLLPSRPSPAGPVGRVAALDTLNA
ncbi:MAG: glycosyltransferase family 2 protein [Pseudomonadota bacterium]